MLRWSLCIATYDRASVLMRCLACAFAQTRLPAEVVVVDASAEWRAAAEDAGRLCEAAGVPLRYLPASARSSAVQRNQAIEAAESDVLFLIDDDSFMQPDCAALIMAVYEADAEGAIAGVCAMNAPEIPAAAMIETAGGAVVRKTSGVRKSGRLRNVVMRTRFGRWINAKVLMQGKEALFLPYEPERPDPRAPDWAAALPARAVRFMPGFATTVRRAVALREPFEGSLRYYTAFEDLDATYRWRRHGALLSLPTARLHHFEAASGRVSRTVVIALQLLNMLVFIKRNAERPETLIGRYRWMLARRLVSELLKDLISRRWRMPQVAGVLVAMRAWREVLAVPRDQLDAWYPEFQGRLMTR